MKIDPGQTITVSAELAEVLNDVIDKDFADYNKEDQRVILAAMIKRLQKAIDQ